MVTINQSTLPGVQTTVESNAGIRTSTSSPADAGIIGGADLANGAASPNEVKEINSPVGARKQFGEDSQLTEQVIDALFMGAQPVYAVAADEISVTGEDLSGLSDTTGTLANEPAVPGSATFTIDGTTKETIEVLTDVSTETVADGETYLNTVHGEFQIDALSGDSDSTNDTVDYSYYDYSSAIEAMKNAQGDVVDFYGIIDESSTGITKLDGEMTLLEQEYKFAMGISGVSTYLERDSDTGDILYTNGYDTSRLQLAYPLRTDTGESLIGAFIGMRAATGISRSLIKQQIGGIDLRETLSPGEMETIHSEEVVPLQSFRGSAMIRADVTCVGDDNTAEANQSTALGRLVTDYVTEIVYDISSSYVGELHIQSVRNSMRETIVDELSELVESNALEAFTVTVTEQDSHTADVDVSVETVKALQNIVANVTAGEIN